MSPIEKVINGDAIDHSKYKWLEPYVGMNMDHWARDVTQTFLDLDVRIQQLEKRIFELESKYESLPSDSR